MPISTAAFLEVQGRKGIKARLTSIYLLVDQCLRTSQRYCRQSFMHKQQVRRFHDKVASQFVRTAWPEAPAVKIPMLFVVGDGCGMNHGKVKKHHADFSTSSMRQLVKRLKAHKYPIEVVLVDEYCTSQVCPDPACRNEEGDRSRSWSHNFPSHTQAKQTCFSSGLAWRTSERCFFSLWETTRAMTCSK